MILAVVSLSGAAQAECLPGQMQEANLAYQSAAEFLTAQQWDQAIARLQSIVQVCPEHVDATRGIGDAYLGKGSYQQAGSWYSKVIALRAANVEAGDFANLAKTYAKLKKYKEARAQYMKAQELAPDDCGVLFNLGVMHYASGYHPQSVEVLEHALTTCPQIREHVLKQLSKSATKAAEQQQRAGNTEKAAYYSGLMNKYGGAAGGSTTMDMVRTKMDQRDYQGAADLLQTSLAGNPNQPNAQLTLARCLDAAGDKSGSVAAYHKYLQMKPTDAAASGTMLQVMVEAGQCAQANAEASPLYNRLKSQGRKALAPVLYSWGLALECMEEYESARGKFAECAASGNAKYAAPGQQQVERMDGFMALKAAEKKKAKQGR